jgi:hypothetical protein
MRILKDFKCRVEMWIPKGLGCFALAGTTEQGWKLDFNAEGTKFTERRLGKRGQFRDSWKFVGSEVERNIGYGSRKSD